MQPERFRRNLPGSHSPEGHACANVFRKDLGPQVGARLVTFSAWGYGAPSGPGPVGALTSPCTTCPSLPCPVHAASAAGGLLSFSPVLPSTWDPSLPFCLRHSGSTHPTQSAQRPPPPRRLLQMLSLTQPDQGSSLPSQCSCFPHQPGHPSGTCPIPLSCPTLGHHTHSLNPQGNITQQDR